jgi:N-acetylneuraminate synthase
MNCKFFNKKFEDEFLKLLPYSDHLHLSDADGLNGEGVKLGTGDIDFKFVMNNISKDQSFIVETWQGHKNDGAGFFEDLRYLDTLLI